jgi:hypothetical protein
VAWLRVLTNMRGLLSDVIADQMMGYIVCFARNLHIDVLQAAAGWWDRSAGQRGSARLGAKVARETCFSWQKACPTRR